MEKWKKSHCASIFWHHIQFLPNGYKSQENDLVTVRIWSCRCLCGHSIRVTKVERTHPPGSSIFYVLYFWQIKRNSQRNPQFAVTAHSDWRNSVMQKWKVLVLVLIHSHVFNLFSLSQTYSAENSRCTITNTAKTVGGEGVLWKNLNICMEG